MLIINNTHPSRIVHYYISRASNYLCSRYCFSSLLVIIFTLSLFSAPLLAQQNSTQLSINKLQTLAQQGQIDAQVKLAIAYEHGEGITKNPQKAVHWYCQAAVKGSSSAQVNLAWMLLNARGIQQDDALAVRWFKSAAKSGDKYAQQMLSRLDTHLQSKRILCKVLPTPYWQTAKCTTACRRVVTMVNDIAPAYNIEPRLVLALIQQESNFKVKALSPKGAMGLMQLMPETAQRYAVKNAWDAQQNIHGGIRYLAWLLKEFHGNVALVLAGYNAGNQAVIRYNGIPPYPETQNYVKRIMKVYGKSHHPYEKLISMNSL